MLDLSARIAQRNANKVAAGFAPVDFGGLAATAAGTGVTASQSEEENNFVTQTFTFKDVAIPGIDTAATVGRATLKFADLPEGLIFIAAAVANLTLGKSSAGINADFDGDFGVGTVAAAGDATLSSTEQNVIPTTATPQAVAGATTAKGVSTAAVVLDGTATAVDLYLNILIDDADQDMTGTPANVIVNGTITLTYLVAGDK